MTYLTRSRRDAAGPDVSVVTMMTSRVIQLPSGDQATVMIDARVAPMAPRRRETRIGAWQKGTGMNINEETIDALVSAQEYLQGGDDPASYPDQATMRRVLPWFLLHREPGHQCDVCVSPIPAPKPLVSFCRKSRALSHLLDGGDRLSFADQEALASVLPVYERSLSPCEEGV